MSLENQRIAVVGATGAVGRELLGILEARGVRPENLRPTASAETAGGRVRVGHQDLLVLDAETLDFRGLQTVFLCANAEVARRLAPRALSAGAFVIDNSSGFRGDAGVPLSVPGVNDADWKGARLIANPNCSAIILVRALDPIRRAFGVRSIVLSTYQAVSGAGLAGIAALHAQTHARLAGLPEPAAVFQETSAFNVFSHDSDVELDSGVNEEERKIIEETRRIWSDPTLPISPTCLRVPVERAHTESIWVELDRPAHESEVRQALLSGGITIRDDRARNQFPTPRIATGTDHVWVGRLRPDPAFSLDADGSTRRFVLLACADQLRVGAALNAVRIAERFGPTFA